MNLTNLSYFLKVAEKEHMTRAAEELHMTQPALSRAISALEAELGVEVFERDGKAIRLNENGVILRQSAERIFQELNELQQKLRDNQSGVAGSICIGSSFPGREPDLVQSCILEFMQQYPDVSINYMQYSPQKLIYELSERNIDIAITSLPVHSEEIEWQEVFTEKLGVLIAADHPLAQKAILKISDLKDERFYCNNSNSDTQDLTQEFCRRAGFEPIIFFQGFFPELIGQAVSRGKGVSFLAESRFNHDQKFSTHYSWQSNLAFRSVEEDYCRRTCGVAYMRKSYHSKAMKLFHAFFLQYISEKHKDWSNDPERT
jgi:DNA-binding transcriptional LysR family regulator